MRRTLDENSTDFLKKKIEHGGTEEEKSVSEKSRSEIPDFLCADLMERTEPRPHINSVSPSTKTDGLSSWATTTFTSSSPENTAVCEKTPTGAETSKSKESAKCRKRCLILSTFYESQNADCICTSGNFDSLRNRTSVFHLT